jgi:hypothetical protein
MLARLVLCSCCARAAVRGLVLVVRCASVVLVLCVGMWTRKQLDTRQCCVFERRNREVDGREGSGSYMRACLCVCVCALGKGWEGGEEEGERRRGRERERAEREREKRCVCVHMVRVLAVDPFSTLSRILVCKDKRKVVCTVFSIVSLVSLVSLCVCACVYMVIQGETGE